MREVLAILGRQRGDRQRDARQVHALVRGDQPARQDGANCPPGLDALDAQPNHAVVDEHVVPRLQHVADRSRADRQLAVARRAGRSNDDLLAACERHRPLEVADAQLRPLQVGDQRERAAAFLLNRADKARHLGVLGAHPVRVVQPGGVHARLDEPTNPISRRRRRADRRDDLRAAALDGHDRRLASAVVSDGRAETPTSRGTRRPRRALPRSAAAGCTSRPGRSSRVRPS